MVDMQLLSFAFLTVPVSVEQQNCMGTRDGTRIFTVHITPSEGILFFLK